MSIGTKQLIFELVTQAKNTAYFLTENLGEKCKGFLHTAVHGKLKWQKKFRYISRLPRECPYPELRNETPLDSLEKPVPNPLMASLWIGSGAGWPLNGLGVASPDHQVGSHFEALDKGVLVAA